MTVQKNLFLNKLDVFFLFRFFCFLANHKNWLAKLSSKKIIVSINVHRIKRKSRKPNLEIIAVLKDRSSRNI